MVACLVPGGGAPQVHDPPFTHVDAELRLPLPPTLEVGREHVPVHHHHHQDMDKEITYTYQYVLKIS